MAGLTIIALAGQAIAGNDTPNRATRTTTTATVPRPDRPTCRGSNQAISYYRKAVLANRSQMGVYALPARRWWGCNSARRRAAEWRQKAADARVALVAYIDFQYDWRSWLPANWYRVGSCETGYGGDPNFHHANGSFVSAFGISRGIYDLDARMAGGPPWNDANPPTPRQQYEAALAHYRRFGDGWGCPGP